MLRNGKKFMTRKNLNGKKDKKLAKTRQTTKQILQNRSKTCLIIKKNCK